MSTDTDLNIKWSDAIVVNQVDYLFEINKTTKTEVYKYKSGS